MADTRTAALRRTSIQASQASQQVLGAAYGPNRCLVELLGWPRASLVCRCWRDAARSLRLTRAEEARLVRAIASGFSEAALANPTWPPVCTSVQLFDGGRSNLPAWAAASAAMARVGVVAIVADQLLEPLLSNLRYFEPQTLDLRRCNATTDFAITVMATRCSHFKEIDLGFCDRISDAAVISLASCCPNMSAIHLTR